MNLQVETWSEQFVPLSGKLIKGHTDAFGLLASL